MRLGVKGYDGLASIGPRSSHCSIHAYQHPTCHDLVLVAERSIVIVAVYKQLGTSGRQSPTLVHEDGLACGQQLCFGHRTLLVQEIGDYSAGHALVLDPF